MAETLKIDSPDNAACLTLRRLDQDYSVAEVSGKGLNASIRVGSFLSESLGEFFAGLAENWKGWSGARTWNSLEGEFGLRARSDRTGHVQLSVRLTEGGPPAWEVEVNLILEAGQLDRIATDASAFITRGIRAS